MERKIIQEVMAAEDLAKRFHYSYEALAPNFGYETRKESAKPWGEVPEQNKKLMIAVCEEVLSFLCSAEGLARENWVSVEKELPPENVAVLTRLTDEKGTRNTQKLILNNRLWWIPPGDMHVYYNPTHWLKDSLPTWETKCPFDCGECKNGADCGKCVNCGHEWNKANLEKQLPYQKHEVKRKEGKEHHPIG